MRVSTVQRNDEQGLCVCDIAARYRLHAEMYYRDARGRKTSSYDGARMAVRAWTAGYSSQNCTPGCPGACAVSDFASGPPSS